MFNEIDKNTLSTLISLYEDLDKNRKKHTKRIAELNMHFSERMFMISNFICNYAAIFYEGLSNASHLPMSEIKEVVQIDSLETTLDESCSNKDILTTLISLYYDIDTKIQEFGEDTCKEHLKGLIERRNMIKLYINIFAKSTFKKLNKDNLEVHEIFKFLHGIYPVPYQKRKRKEQI